MTRPFRFIAPMPQLGDSARRWRDAVREIEDLGFSTISVSEHLTHSWKMEPLVAMTALAEATSSIRVLSLVIANDYRHPALLHKAIATLDVLSEGRVELGIGTGWLSDDYAAAGIEMAPPAARVARLAESVQVLKGLFGPRPFSFAGSHYTIRGLDGLPKPVQQPHPPFLIGGGARMILELAAREADIVSVHPALGRGSLAGGAARGLTLARFEEKVAIARAAAVAAGRPSDALEWQCSVYLTRISGSKNAAAGALSSFAAQLAADPALLADSPAVLAGSVDQCVEKLLERRERLGFSYVNLGNDTRAVAAIVARLTGR